MVPWRTGGMGPGAGAARTLAMSSEALKFELDGRTIQFATLDDFAFSLTGRAQIAATSVTDLMALSPNELRREATGIRDMERRFVDLLADALKDPHSVGALLAGIDGNLIAEDNQWRTILAALAGESARFDEYKHLALVKYMQYLAARRDVVKSIYAQRFGAQEPLAAQDAGGDVGSKSTLIMDEDAEADTVSSQNRFERLPRGETVTVRTPSNGELAILLSRHRFQLFADDRPRITDDNGVNYPLKPGVNVIGRHPDNDVVVGGWYRDVSRKHLMVNARDGDVTLTDLSTHGTFLPGSLLGNADE
jgi:hypothetical protein